MLGYLYHYFGFEGWIGWQHSYTTLATFIIATLLLRTLIDKVFFSPLEPIAKTKAKLEEIDRSLELHRHGLIVLDVNEALDTRDALKKDLLKWRFKSSLVVLEDSFWGLIAVWGSMFGSRFAEVVYITAFLFTIVKLIKMLIEGEELTRFSEEYGLARGVTYPLTMLIVTLVVLVLYLPSELYLLLF